jgi:hypothetical protein
VRVFVVVEKRSSHEHRDIVDFMDTKDDASARPEIRERTSVVSQEEADRFNGAMEARRLPHRARIDMTGTPHYVIEPPLPPALVEANYESIYADRETRRSSLVEHRDRATDPQTLRRLDLMIDNHDRGTDRVRSHDPKQND